jgi:hypothetical protein
VKKARGLSTPVGADEGKADRPLSRAVAALRPWGGGFSTEHHRVLSGRERIAEGKDEPVAMLSAVRESDRNVVPSTRSARVWSTATPAAPPGFDDPDGLRNKLHQRPNGPPRHADQQKSLWERLNRRAVERIVKAFRQGGLPNELIGAAELEYREVGSRPGVDLARRYDLPPLKHPRCHVRVRFPRPMAGPLVVGAGRYRGLGLFAADGRPTAPCAGAHTAWRVGARGVMGDVRQPLAAAGVHWRAPSLASFGARGSAMTALVGRMVFERDVGRASRRRLRIGLW